MFDRGALVARMRTCADYLVLCGSADVRLSSLVERFGNLALPTYRSIMFSAAPDYFYRFGLYRLTS